MWTKGKEVMRRDSYVQRCLQPAIAIPWCLVVVLTIALCILLYRHAELRLRMAFADEQTSVFADLIEEVKQGRHDDVVEVEEYIRNYYPSGTKQVADSRLDYIVERARVRAVRELRLIQELSKKSE